MSSLKFGTSGLRGLAEDMKPEVCARYVHAFLHHIDAAGPASPAAPVLVGRDLRESSPVIAAACVAAIVAAGRDAVDCGALPTPALALEAMRRGAPAIMVTGSHIPADRNGLKFYRPDGEIDKADEAGILARFARPGDGPATPRRGVVREDPGALDNYRRRYTRLDRAFALDGMRVGIYQHSSVARDLLAEVLAALGAEVVPLGRSAHFVPVDTEALTRQDIEQARDWAARSHLDAIVSTDGDADRPLVADERGAFLRGDAVGILTAAFLGAGTVVTPVTSSTAVEASELFGAVIRTRVGSPYVIAAMAGEAAPDAGVVVGFEANGGVLLGSDVRRDGLDLAALPTRDSLLPILSVLASARRGGAKLSQLVGGLPPRFTLSDRLENVAAAASAAFLAGLSGKPAADAFLGKRGSTAAIDRTDGVRLALASGDTLHFRASGNAPELRCYAESATPEGARRLLEWGLAAAAAALAGRPRTQ